jgi:hypothetical protein
MQCGEGNAEEASPAEAGYKYDAHRRIVLPSHHCRLCFSCDATAGIPQTFGHWKHRASGIASAARTVFHLARVHVPERPGPIIKLRHFGKVSLSILSHVVQAQWTAVAEREALLGSTPSGCSHFFCLSHEQGRSNIEVGRNCVMETRQGR